MKSNRTLTYLSFAILALALVAAGAGVFWRGAPGEGSFEHQNVQGDTVMIWGRGLYRHDSVSGASQEISQDVVTLVIGLPLLLAATLLNARGSLRGRLLLTGTLGYFLYTYTSMSFLTAYNPLFLLYVSLFGLGLFAFVLAITGIDVESLPGHFSSSLPRIPIVIFFFMVAAFLLFAWLGGIVLPSLMTGTTPSGLDNYTTLVIQALDLGVIVPTALLTSWLLLRRRPLGYLLAAVVLMKLMTMAFALTAMIIGQALAGVSMPAFMIALFPLLGVAGVALAVLTFKSIQEIPVTDGEQRPLAAAQTSISA